MLRIRIDKKIIAISLIISFIFANSFGIFSNISFAETTELGRQGENRNINYDVIFEQNGEEKGYEYEGNITDENLSLHIKLEIKNEGYLKNAKILIESENGLSFNINAESTDKYQVKDNQIELSNLSAGEKLDIKIPINYKERTDIENLNKKITVKLIGIFVNNLGEEENISENVILRLIWNTNTDFTLNSKIEKYIPYETSKGKGIIIQTNLESSIPINNNFVSKEEIKLEGIQIEGYKLDKISILKESGDELSQNEWEYSEEENKITIKLESNEEAIQSEEFLITYIFSGDKEIQLPFITNSKINGTVFMFGTDEKIEKETTVEYKATEKIGDIITVEGKTTESIKIGNIVANKINQEKNYSTSYEVELISNISSTDMVTGISIKDLGEEFENQEGIYQNTTSYYKTIKISKENFEKMLSSEGCIQIQKENGEIINTINKETKVDEQNNYVVNVEENINKINIKTTAPISEGNLRIFLTKEIIDTEYTVEQLKTFNNLNLKYSGNILYSEDIENKVSDINLKIELVKPQTKADLSISRDTLSTISQNNDIEMTVKLNNTNEDIDLYKNPSFEITFPQNIESVEITNISIANSEDTFEIAESSISKNEQGNLVLNIRINGTQVKYNSNNLSNGSNIIIKANITLNIYSQTQNEKITMTYTNENATSYSNSVDGKGYTETDIKIKAPIGMVSVNKISNYNNVGGSIESVEQGKVTDKIEIFDEAKIATMDILVMNNNENNSNNIKILGRIPFKGNKDVATGEDLGTTIDTTLTSLISENNENLAKATIYYSSNGEATEDIEDPENGWQTQVDDLSKIKSYLIVLNNYEMKPGEILRYSYQYRIPANLEHNTNIFGSFKTIYTNLKDVATVEEISSPDIVGLTTGTGPQISVETTSNIKDTVKEYEKIKYTINVENTGTDIAENIIVTTKIPTGTTLAIHKTQNTLEETKGWTLKNDKEVTTQIDSLKPGETKTIELFVQVNKLPTIEQYYANTEGFSKNADGSYSLHESYTDENRQIKYKDTIINNIPDIELICETTLTAKDLAKELKVQNGGIIVQKSKLVAEETISTEESIAKENETIESKIQIKNNSEETMKNITITKVLPEGLKYSESYIRGYEDDGITIKKINTSNYDSETRTVTWTIESLEPQETIIAIGNFVIDDMKENVYKDEISTISNIYVDGEQYQAGQVDIEIGRPHLEIEQTSNKTNEYVKIGDEIEYIFNVKNTGSVEADNVILKDILPEEVKIKKLSYTSDGIEVSKVVTQNEDATVYTSILPENEMQVKITAKVGEINQSQRTIKNVATISSSNEEEQKSNEITNIIERTNASLGEESSEIDNESNNNENNENQDIDENVKTKYEIKGIAWIDNNKDGMRNAGEDKFSGMEVKLLNSETGDVIYQTATSIDGEYKFENLENGTYMVIFYYDSSRYTLTDYRKQGVAENENSDVITATEENTKIATTDIITIKDGSKSNIDIGLIEATTFDLSLEKRITKITVQTNKETKTYDFDYTDLAKVDINAKYLDNAKVIVEYAITVKNEGELAGYAKQIVDYMPNDLEFNTDLNKSWYKGNDGNLYTDELSDEVIESGESKEVKLILTKTMTENNTGISNNQAEIAESYNQAGIADYDSEPNDQNSKDDDLSSADLIIGVQTGDSLIYLSVIITIMVIGIITIVLIRKSKILIKIQANKEKEV